jgi:hypothetical protein
MSERKQLGPLGYRTAVGLPSSFRQDADHQNCCQRIAHSAPLALILDSLELFIQGFSINEQRLIGKYKLAKNGCRVHE